MDNIAYIGLGSNLGDRMANISSAIKMLQNTVGTTLCVSSAVYETEPIGYLEQPLFLNCVVKIKTTLSPRDLLQLCMDIENELLRKRDIKWGPRTVDLDILFYNDLVIKTDELIIPHPLLHEREFVIVPLMDIAPKLIHPLLRKTVCEIYNTLTKKDEIKRFGDLH